MGRGFLSELPLAFSLCASVRTCAFPLGVPGYQLGTALSTQLGGIPSKPSRYYYVNVGLLMLLLLDVTLEPQELGI